MNAKDLKNENWGMQVSQLNFCYKSNGYDQYWFKTIRIYIFYFSVVLPGSLFLAGKYSKHLNQLKK